MIMMKSQLINHIYGELKMKFWYGGKYQMPVDHFMDEHYNERDRWSDVWLADNAREQVNRPKSYQKRSYYKAD